MRLASLLDDFRAWRERRSVIGEIRKMDRDAADYAGFENGKLLNEMTNAASIGDRERVLRLWGEFRRRAPGIALTSVNALKSLSQVGLLDELNAALDEAMQRYPGNRELLHLWANLASGHKDWPEACRRFAVVRGRFPNSFWAHFHGAIALRNNGESEASDQAWVQALALDPKHAPALSEYALNAEFREDWPAALQRFEVMRERVEDIGGWTGVGRALRRLGREDEALAILQEARRVRDSRWEPAVDIARIERGRGNLEAALVEYQAARQRSAQVDDAWLDAVAILRQLGRDEEADQVMIAFIRRPRTRPEQILNYAREVHGKDWPEAVKRWALVRERLPQHPDGYGKGAEALEAVGDLEAASLVRAMQPVAEGG